MAMTGSRDPLKPRRCEPKVVEVMPLRGRGHGCCGLAGGQAYHSSFQYRPQTGPQHDIGVGGGDGAVEDRSKQGASVCHRSLRRVIYSNPAKENPRSELRGPLRDVARLVNVRVSLQRRR